MKDSYIDYEQLEQWVTIYNRYKQKKRKKQILTLIVMTCKPLINNISYGLARRSSDPVEDIIQVANIGLIKAIKRYKSEYKNLKIYLSYAIIGEIKHYLRDKTRLLKPPREIIELSYRINKLSAEDIERAGEQYNNKTIAKALNTSEEKIIEAFTIDRRQPISLNQVQFNNENFKTYEDNLPEEEKDFDYLINSYRDILQEAIKNLPEKLQKIITGIYFENLSQTTLAGIMNTSQSNISRMQKRAVKLLFEMITSDNVKDNRGTKNG